MRVGYEGCPLCDSLQVTEVNVSDCTRHPFYRSEIPSTIRWMQCADCEHVFTEGYWSNAALDVIFSQSHDNQTPGHDMENGRYIASEIVEKIVDAGVSSGRWLDVGFGNGALMFTAAEYGFDVVGLDLRKTTVETMSAIGLEAHHVDITKFATDEPFAVISFADCLEHIPFPTRALQAARNLLRDDGCLFLSMPNSGAPLWGYLSQTGANPYWGEIEHYHNFSKDRLSSLLKEVGFDVIRYGISKRYRCCMEVIAKRC